MTPLSPVAAAALRNALALARSGALAEARTVARTDGHPALHAFLGTVCGRMDDWIAAAGHLGIAHTANPDDMTVTGNLLDALIAIGRWTEALVIASEDMAGRDPTGRIGRGRGYALQRLDRYAEAAAAYRAVVAAHPHDAEAWNNLGNSLAGSGDSASALTALHRAAGLAAANGPVQLNLATTLIAAGELDGAERVLRARLIRAPDDLNAINKLTDLLYHLHRDDDALTVLERAVAARPADATLHVRLAEGHAMKWDFAAAGILLQRALSIDPGNAAAFVQLALTLEHDNQDGDLALLADRADAAGIDEGTRHFLRALACRRAGRFADGLAHVLATPDAIEPVRRLQLEGQFRDRLGDAAGAFAAFAAMNAMLAADPSAPRIRADRFARVLAARRMTVTPKWAGRWRHEDASTSTAPVFIVGFPRSGTTLLDTILLGHRDVQVLEERPPLQCVEDAVGDYARLPELNGTAVTELRDLYWREVGKYCALSPDTILVDKHPLYMNKLPLIHRLFPNAKVVLALRHPCDVILSCFMTSFRLNDAMSTFLDLNETASLYAESFGFFEQTRTLLPIDIHELRYEALISEPAKVVQTLFDWLELAWDDSVLDHRRTAKRRGVISTASYAQVTEPLYRRAAGRWSRYRTQLEPVIPILRPWLERYGYALDG